jgi:hypothetical protein
MTGEETVFRVLTNCTAVDVVYSQITRFEEKHGKAPERCVVNSIYRSAIVHALLERIREAKAAIADPFYIDFVPVYFAKLDTQTYIVTSREGVAIEIL